MSNWEGFDVEVVYVEDGDPEPECKDTIEWLHWKARQNSLELMRNSVGKTYEETCNQPCPMWDDAIKTFIEENPEHMEAAHKAWDALSEEDIIAFTKAMIREEDGSSLLEVDYE